MPLQNLAGRGLQLKPYSIIRNMPLKTCLLNNMGSCMSQEHCNRSFLSLPRSLRHHFAYFINYHTEIEVQHFSLLWVSVHGLISADAVIWWLKLCLVPALKEKPSALLKLMNFLLSSMYLKGLFRELAKDWGKFLPNWNSKRMWTLWKLDQKLQRWAEWAEATCQKGLIHMQKKRFRKSVTKLRPLKPPIQ